METWFLERDTTEWIYFTVTYLCFLSFWHSSLFIFTKTKNVTSGPRFYLKLLSMITWNSVPIHFLFIKSSLAPSFITVGITLSSLALAIYWFSVYSLTGQKFAVIHGSTEPTKIYKESIYKFIRHPFYTSYLIAYFGVALTIPTLIHFILIALIFRTYLKAASDEELYFLNSSLGDEYKQFQRETGKFLPKFWRF